MGAPGRFTLQSAIAATGNGTPMDVTGFKAVAVQITGTFTATVTFETSVNGADWIATGLSPVAGGAVSTTAAAAGIWTLTPNGVALLRARVSAYTSGNVTAVGRGSTL